MKGLIFASFALLLQSLAASGQSKNEPYALVDPFIGTKPTATHDSGQTVPGAVRPFGLLYWSPDPDDDLPQPPGFYVDRYHFQYDLPVLRGFSLTHLSGEGCGIFGDAPFLPMLGAPGDDPQSRAAEDSVGYQTSDEVAAPGYYSVKLASGITVRLAANVHSGIAELVYPSGAKDHTVILSLDQTMNRNKRIYGEEVRIGGSEITGSISAGDFCGGGNRYRLYFVLKFDRTPSSSGTRTGERWDVGNNSANGLRTRAYVSFPSSAKRVLIRAGISYVSVDNARLNLQSEIPGWNFERVRNDARKAWSDVLRHVQVRGGTDDERKIFYTAFYHALIDPSVFSDVNGEYLGFDNKVHQISGRTQYANFSGWDVYRDQMQLIAMLFPKVGSDIAQSIVADAEQAGRLPKWSVANDESNVMVGDPAAAILASIYAFGARDFDARGALAAMVRGADVPDLKFHGHPERPDLKSYLDRGYVYYLGDAGIDEEGTENNGSASVTLEYETADFAISRMAEALGDHEVAELFLARSAAWRKSFDAETRYIRALDKDGNFRPGFEIGNVKGYVEGNAAQYTWMVPYDLTGLIQAIGGGEAVKARLDEYFSRYGDDSAPYFNISNEPSFIDPWIYNWAGYPWRTQEVLHKTLKDLFKATPDGLPGNDDLGATSAWCVFAQLGFYPVIPGVGGVTFNTPAFPEVSLFLGDHRLRILAAHAGEDLYVQSIAVDGRPITNWWLPWDEMAKAAELRFSLGPTPAKSAGEPPPSFPPPQKAQ